MSIFAGQERGARGRCPKFAKKMFNVCKDLEHKILLFNTFPLRYYMAIHVNILDLPVFGGPFFEGPKNGVERSNKKFRFVKTFKIFYSYICEIWGFCAADKLDTFYLGFLKSILGVWKTTPSAFIYRELNIYPLKLRRCIRIFKYWLKIIALPDHEPVKSVYNVLKDDASSSPDTVNWVSLLKKVLDESGLGYLWGSQLLLPEDKSYYTALFKDRLQDIILQNYITDLDKISNNRLCKHIDHDFYVQRLPNSY